MDYEKKYKEALERAKESMKDGGISQNTIDYLCNIFQELKEPEDERIRKEIINSIKELRLIGTSSDREKAIAWLEKQGTKEVDPRYKNLEELLVAGNIYQMAMNDAMVEEAKEKAAKALSELGIGKLLGFEKQGEKKIEPNLHVGNNKDNERLIKTTIAFLKDYAEQGYENAVECIDWLEKQGEKEIKPKSDVWTEQDKTILEGIICEIEANKNGAPSYDLPTYDKFLNWLKSLRNKIKNE